MFGAATIVCRGHREKCSVRSSARHRRRGFSETLPALHMAAGMPARPTSPSRRPSRWDYRLEFGQLTGRAASSITICDHCGLPGIAPKMARRQMQHGTAAGKKHAAEIVLGGETRSP